MGETIVPATYLDDQGNPIANTPPTTGAPAATPPTASAGPTYLDEQGEPMAAQPPNTGGASGSYTPNSTWENIKQGIAQSGFVKAGGNLIEHPVSSIMSAIAPLSAVDDQQAPVSKKDALESPLDAIKHLGPMLDRYETARSQGSSIPEALYSAANQVSKQNDTINAITNAVKEFKQNPTMDTAKIVTDLAGMVGSLWLAHQTGSGGMGFAAEGTDANAADALFPHDEPGSPVTTQEAVATPSSNTPSTPAQPSITSKVRSYIADKAASPREAGEAATTEAGTTAVQDNVPTVGPSLRSGIDTQAPFSEAKTLYQTVDKAAGTNFQDLYAKLDNAQDEARLAASGSPEEAKAQLNIKNTQDAIDDAKAIAAKSGVADVDKTLAEADAKFTEAQANKDFNSKFLGNQGVINGNIAHGAPETVNVDKAIDTLENMDKPNKYGASRLQQTSLGKEGAFKLKQALYDAQKAGETAMDARTFRNTILKWTGMGFGAAATGAYLIEK